jgi:hypothetical protein
MEDQQVACSALPPLLFLWFEVGMQPLENEITNQADMR